MAPPLGQQLSPYGILGDLARALGPSAGGAIGSWLGNEHLGRQLGDYAGQLAQRFSPYAVGPQMAQAPQQPQMPTEILSVLAQLPPHVLAQLVTQAAQIQQAQAAPAQIAPYGFFGDIVGKIAPHVGDYFGGSTGRQIGDVAGQLAQRYLPFSAGPVMPAAPQLAPYGFFGDIVSSIAPRVGEYFGGSTGRTIGDVAGHLASYIPFSAGPQMPMTPVVPMAAPQLAPYGIFGGALGNFLGGHAGHAIGGWLGNSGAGSAVGSALGTALGSVLPFAAGPQLVATPWGQPAFVPQYR
jgi:hypothetical protein